MIFLLKTEKTNFLLVKKNFDPKLSFFFSILRRRKKNHSKYSTLISIFDNPLKWHDAHISNFKKKLWPSQNNWTLVILIFRHFFFRKFHNRTCSNGSAKGRVLVTTSKADGGGGKGACLFLLHDILLAADTVSLFFCFRATQWGRNLYKLHLICSSKVPIFWEGHKIMKRYPNSIWHYLLSSKKVWRFFNTFVAFSEYMNFTALFHEIF